MFYINEFESAFKEKILKKDLLIKIIDEISNIMKKFNGSEELLIIINENLNELFISMKEQDYMKFLDILKYELLPLIDSSF
ncbi:hypothetical protein ABG79_02206 [Caloramator mitchellensis]|uniref:Uncharacterized protein n=2 Tax=Caloramator mitchellensis TaxID=908809 RepID=A0A0R3JSM7_CALMK|nr:hypothetical protein ABG79_02206 [Caloramator mitchellensis]